MQDGREREALERGLTAGGQESPRPEERAASKRVESGEMVEERGRVVGGSFSSEQPVYISETGGERGVESRRKMTKEMTWSGQFRTPRTNGKSEQFKPTRLVT